MLASLHNKWQLVKPERLNRDSVPGISTGDWTHSNPAWHLPKCHCPRRKAGVQHKPHCFSSFGSVGHFCQVRIVGTLLKSKFPDASQQVFHTGPSKGNSSVALLTFLHLDQKADVKFSSLGLYHLELKPAMTASFKKKRHCHWLKISLLKLYGKKKSRFRERVIPHFWLLMSRSLVETVLSIFVC